MQAEIISQTFHLDDTGADAVHYVFECSGAPPCIQTGVLLLSHLGTFIQVRLTVVWLYRCSLADDALSTGGQLQAFCQFSPAHSDEPRAHCERIFPSERSRTPAGRVPQSCSRFCLWNSMDLGFSGWPLISLPEV
jgi:hypothetical protein